MDEKIKGYIEKNVSFYEPVFHVFETKVMENGQADTGDYYTENDMDREPYWHDNNISQDYKDWDKMIKDIEEMSK